MPGSMRILWIVPLAASLFSAQEAPRPAFDVLSVKHVGDAESLQTREGNTTYSNQQQVRFAGGSMSCKTTLRAILRAAYALKDYQIQGPDWMDREVYQIDARMPDGTSRSTQLRMLQSALAHRLGLKVRLEKKEFPVFLLVTTPGAKKLEKIDTDNQTYSFRMGMDSMEAIPGMTMSGLAGMLADPAGRPVLDETGLDGIYKVKLQWTEEPPRADAGVIQIGRSYGMISALPQLGLKLEPAKRMLDNLVVESVSKEPTEN
jgi:uncharacterized protein (TIGR03435 family)